MRDQLLRQAEQLYEEIGAPLYAARLAARGPLPVNRA
jgi:hypothetical protein